MNNYIRQRDNELSFAMVIDFLLRFKWPIIIVTLAAGLLAVIFSAPYFIHPKYKSSVILYPATTNSISKSILSYQATGPNSDFLAFGEEEEAEQLLQILQSDYITNQIIKKYDLMKHYHIDPNGKYPYTKLLKEFNKNISYRRTEFSSIEIAVMDEDKFMAADMANDIAAYADSAKTNVKRERAQDALVIVTKKYHQKVAFIGQLVDSLQATWDKGIFAEQSLSDRIKFENEELAKMRTKLEQVQADAEQSLPASFIINKAVPSEKKAYPVRGLIVLISMASAFAASVILLAMIENYRNYKKRKLLDEISITAAATTAEHSYLEA